jgi:quinol monooxygenase YgiN
MIIVLATIESTIEDIENLRQAIIDIQIATTTKEPGNISYIFNVELTNSGNLQIIEQWQSMDALQEHLATPHMADFKKAMAGFPPKSMNVKVYEIEQELPFPKM